MQEVDSITGQIIGAAIRVHKKYGPGLLESVYVACLGHELVALGLKVEVEKPLSLKHDGLVIHRAYVLDLLVEDQVIVEVKCVSKIAPIHTAQLLTYLRLTGLHLGLIVNFNVPKLVEGIKRVANDYQGDENGHEEATRDH
jgi:GxxExxY protein